MSHYQLLTETTNFNNDYKLQNNAESWSVAIEEEYQPTVGENRSRTFDLKRLCVDSPITRILPQNCQAVLETTDYRHKHVYSKPALFHNTTSLKPKGPNYQIFLRILERLIKSQNLCFATLPEIHTSDVWRRHVPLPKQWEGDSETNAIPPKETNVILDVNSQTFKPTRPFPSEVFVFETIGIQIQNKTWTLEKETPFIAIDTQDPYTDLSFQDVPQFICNQAFLNLTTTNPEHAEELYRDALTFGHRYSEALWADEFLITMENDPTFITHRDLAIAHAQKQFKHDLHTIAKHLIEGEIPDLFATEYTLELHNLTFANAEVKVDATVTTQLQSWNLQIDKGKATIKSSQSTNQPAEHCPLHQS